VSIWRQETKLAVFYLSDSPTEQDRTGCEGVYVLSMEVKHFREWPLRYKIWLPIKTIVKGVARWIFTGVHGITQ